MVAAAIHAGGAWVANQWPVEPAQILFQPAPESVEIAWAERQELLKPHVWDEPHILEAPDAFETVELPPMRPPEPPPPNIQPLNPEPKPEMTSSSPRPKPAPSRPRPKEPVPRSPEPAYQLAGTRTEPDLNATARRIPPPRYPASARAEGIEGTVVLTLTIDTTGRVVEARVQRSSGDVRLDQAAVRDVKNTWRFSPARRAGIPVFVQQTAYIVFELRKPGR